MSFKIILEIHTVFVICNSRVSMLRERMIEIFSNRFWITLADQFLSIENGAKRYNYSNTLNEIVTESVNRLI